MSLVQDKIQEGMTGITFFGGWGFVIVTLIAFFAVSSRFFLFFLVGLGVVEIGGDLTKALFFKKRPNGQKYKTLLEKIDAGSWPSIHSARAVVFGVGYWLWFNNAILQGLVLTMAVLVCYSRVHIKKHDWFDVLSGVLFGILVSFGTWYLFFGSVIIQ